jgi:hypothetical protein
VESGQNTFIVIPANRKRLQKGNLVVSDEIVIYGYESSATLTTDRFNYKLQTRPPSSRQRGRPKAKSKAIARQKKGKREIWSMFLRTVDHDINSTHFLLNSITRFSFLIVFANSYIKRKPTRNK